MLDKIEALLRKAESTTFEAEAATFYAKAQELMEKYAISEESLWQIDPSKAERPIFEHVTIKGDGTHNKFSLLTTIASCNRCVAWYDQGSSPQRRTRGTNTVPSRHHYEVTISGYPSDISFVLMLYTSLMLQMDLASVIAEVEEEEIESLRSWRMSFTEGFCDRVESRIQQQYLNRKGESKSTDLVLAREQKVKDFITSEGIFFEDFSAPSRNSFDYGAYDAGSDAGSNADIGNDRLPNRRKELA